MNSKNSGGYIGVIVAIIIVIMIGMGSCSSGGGSGDGKSTCRNCGRSKSLSYAGYCSTCQQGFNDWQKSYYGKE